MDVNDPNQAAGLARLDEWILAKTVLFLTMEHDAARVTYIGILDRHDSYFFFKPAAGDQIVYGVAFQAQAYVIGAPREGTPLGSSVQLHQPKRTLDGVSTLREVGAPVITLHTTPLY